MKPSAATALAIWSALSGGLLWIAFDTGRVLAWIAFALASLMPTLMMMVIAQTPERPAARIMHDRE